MKKYTLHHQFQRFIKKSFLVTKYDKCNESDQQMLQRISIKFAALFLIVLMFDTLVDLLLGLIDFALHIMHLMIEAIEYSFLVVLEKLFSFDHKLSETILVNTAIIIALFLAYRFILAAPVLYVRVKQYTVSAWRRYIAQKSSCWKASSFGRKIKSLSAYSLGAACLVLIIG